MFNPCLTEVWIIVYEEVCVGPVASECFQLRFVIFSVCPSFNLLIGTILYEFNLTSCYLNEYSTILVIAVLFHQNKKALLFSYRINNLLH